MNEVNYIRYRKLKAALDSLCFFLCRVFPIDKNLISVCTFEGKGGYGCNPKYVVQELHKRNPRYRFVWLVNKEAWHKKFPDYITKVNNSSIWSRAYWLSTSRVWIDNYRKPLGTVKRHGQFYINVNHYTIGIKCTGLLRGKGFSKMAYIVSKHDSEMIDELVIDSKWCEECFEKALVYKGHLMKTGSPRCDVLYGDRSYYKELFRKRHNIPLNAKVVMYAPTFREGQKEGKRFVFAEKCSLNYESLINVLEKKTGETWYICLRVHPQLVASHKPVKDKGIHPKIIDESQSDDMYEILAGMDAYITDYSSAIFEAGFAGIPAFVYADDIDKYATDRGNLYWKLSSKSQHYVTNNKKIHPNMKLLLPFSISTNNVEMENEILEFNAEHYKHRMEDFCKAIELVFDGKASKRLADKVEKVML